MAHSTARTLVSLLVLHYGRRLLAWGLLAAATGVVALLGV